MTREPGKLSRGRRRGVRALVVIGAMLTFTAIYSVWVERQLLNTDDWVATSAEIIEDDTIRTAVADYLVDQLYEHVDMEREIEEILPDAVSGLAGPAAGGIRQGAGQAAEFLLDTRTAKDLWASANRAAHSELVDVLDGGDGHVQTEDGVVTLDLGAMLRDLADQVGVGQDLAEEIPPEAANVEILRSDNLGTAQDVARAIRGLAILLTLLAIVAFASAVALARGRRWVALLGVAAGMAGAAFAALVVRSVTGGIVVDELVVDPSVEPAATASWSIGTGLLAGIATSVIFFAIALGLAAWLVSPAPSARRSREFLAPGLRDQAAAFYVGIAVVLGLYLLLFGDGGLRSLITVVAIAILALVGVRELRRMTAEEFPDAPPWRGAEEARRRFGRAASELGRKSRDRIESRKDRAPDEPAEPTSPAGPSVEASIPAESSPAAEPSTPVEPPAPAGSSTSIDRLESLERLAALHERGIIDDEELAAEKARILGKRPDRP